MTQTPDRLIASLADDLQPVRVLHRRDGLLRTALVVALAVVAVLIVNGPRPGLSDGQFSVFFLLANGVLVMLGISAAVATVAMASPGVGNRHDGPRWASLVAGVMPVAALALLAIHWRQWNELMHPLDGLHCFIEGSVTALVVAVPLLLWLRRGAAVAPRQAGTWLGVAAGALGSAAYGLSCPADSLYHLAIWHFLPVVLMGAVGRFAVPALIRW